tara:strand:- start:1207 stop:1602 length:396 start_codon:yes stop_codon:yes gene_type:complete
MQKENYLYFAKTGTAGDAVTDAACYPVSSFLGSQPLSATTTGLYFKDSTNLAHSAGSDAGKHNLVTLTHANISATANIHKEVARAVARIAANPGRGKVLTVVDTANGVVAEEFEAINDATQVTCTAIAITQ